MTRNAKRLIGAVLVVWGLNAASQAAQDDDRDSNSSAAAVYTGGASYSLPSEALDTQWLDSVPSRYERSASDYSVDFERLRLESLRSELDADIDALRRSARDLDWSAMKLRDGSSNWRDVLPEVEYDLSRTQRRLRDAEWSSLRSGADPMLEYDLSRIRRSLRDVQSGVDAARSGDSWRLATPGIVDGAYDASRKARGLDITIGGSRVP